MAEQSTKMVEGAAPRSGYKIRLINDVLMEPGRRNAPPKRRKRVAKRSEEIKPPGNIQKYFAQICVPKEWCATPKMEGASNGVGGGGGAGLLKRKGDLSLEELMHGTRSKKSKKLSVEETDDVCMNTNSRTKCPVLWGTKSGIGKEPTGRLEMMKGNGLNLKSLTEKEGGNASLGLDKMTNEFI